MAVYLDDKEELKVVNFLEMPETMDMLKLMNKLLQSGIHFPRSGDNNFDARFDDIRQLVHGPCGNAAVRRQSVEPKLRLSGCIHSGWRRNDLQLVGNGFDASDFC